MSDQVIVVGGGIGGLAAACMMARQGIGVRVLERAPELSEVGAGLQLAPNATRTLARFGLLDEIAAGAVRPRRLVARNAVTGEELTSVDLAQAERRYGAPYLVLHRRHLLEVLVRACRGAGVTIENGKEVLGVEGDEVLCSDGSRYSAGAVVGADGLRSRLRAELSDDTPACSGYVAYRGAVPSGQVRRRGPSDEVIAWLGPGLHLVQYAVSDELYNQVAVFRSDRWADGEADWGTPQELDARFSVCCAHVREAVPALLRNRRWPMYDRGPLANWSSGRLTLLGDAAHAMLQYLAQGAGQALEDAAALADELGQVGWAERPGIDEIGRAFGGYEKRRVEQANRVQATSRTWGDIWHVDGLAMTLRDEAFRLREPADFRRVDWLYGPPAEPTA